MPMFRKKPKDVEAEMFDGSAESIARIGRLAGHWVHLNGIGGRSYVTTPSGSLPLAVGDWVVKGGDADFYPVTGAIFPTLFDPLDEPATPANLRTKADALEAEAKRLRGRASELRHGELRAKSIGDRLVYAADSRCPCGAGLAYDPAHVDPDSVFRGPLSNFWDCSAILLGTADRTVKHTDRLPFAFYEVKSEEQPSAMGRTTRPKPQ